MVIMSAISNKNPISLWGQIPKRPQDDNKKSQISRRSLLRNPLREVVRHLTLKKKVFFLNGVCFFDITHF
jgi:hypothetical protein